LEIASSVCEKYFSGDTGAEGSDEIENVVLRRRVREKEQKFRQGKLRGLKSAAASWI
jgi:hypothetical protein